MHAFEAKTKANIDLESFVAEDHFLRRINRVLDLSFIRELTTARYSDGQGRPSIDPEVYFRMQLVRTSTGLRRIAACARKSATTWPIAGSAGCRWMTTCRIIRR